MCLCVKILDLFLYSTIMLLVAVVVGGVMLYTVCGIRNLSTTVREQAPYNNQFLPRTTRNKKKLSKEIKVL